MGNRVRPRRRARNNRKRGAVAVYVAMMLTALAGFAALTIDVGAMYSAKADLQRCADAAALAAASRLAAYDQGDPMTLARAEAVKFAGKNVVFGRGGEATQLSTTDVTFGRAVLHGTTYDFEPTTTFPDAVKVSVHLDSGSANGPLPLRFARVFGYYTKDLSAEAVAVMVPRDIAVVADLSASHTDDSELANYKRNTNTNLWDVWDKFPGGVGEAVSSWAGNEFTGAQSYNMAGPAWGYMKKIGFGNQTIPSNYNPTTDTGLVYLPQGQTWSNSTLRTWLGVQKYSTSEIDAIMSSANDSGGYWDERVAVALGLATWNSGITGGRWSKVGETKVGNANTAVASSEITWVEKFGSRSQTESTAIWKDYLTNYANQTWTEMYHENSNFRYRYGIKTFVNYLMERRYQNDVTPELAATPEQPMQAVKDAVLELTTGLEDQETNDRLSLEIYGETGRHEVDLTDNFTSISDRLTAMQAGHYEGWTNMGAGIMRGIEELTNTNAGAAGARPISRKVIFLLTDGKANVSSTGSVGDEDGGVEYARSMANLAASKGIRIFTVSVGVDADQTFMQEVAQIGSGQHFHAGGDTASYSAELQQIFNTLGGTRPVELIK